MDVVTEQAGRSAKDAYGLGLLVSLTAALVIVLTGIDVQSARIPDSEGHTWAFSRLFGPDFGSGANAQGWTVLTTPGELTVADQFRFDGLLRAHLIIDVLFATAYGAVLLVLIRLLAKPRWQVWLRRLVIALVVADWWENVTAGLLALPVLRIATTLKWWLVVAVVLGLVLSVIVPRAPAGAPSETARTRIRRAVKAVVHQRFLYAPVLAIAALSLPSGAAILEQLPDVQRRWVFDDAGPRHALAAMLATLTLGLFLLLIGRRRTVYTLRHPLPAGQSDNPRDPAYVPAATTTIEQEDRLTWQDRTHLGVWLVGPVLALTGAALALRADAPVIPIRLAVFVAVPVVGVLVTSWVIRRAWLSRRGRDRGWYRPDRPIRFGDQDRYAVGLAGSIAGIAAIVVGGLSLLRAYTPLVVLRPADYLRDGGDRAAAPVGVWVLMAVGLGAVILPWWVMIRLTDVIGVPGRAAHDWPRSRPGLALTAAATRLHVLRPVRAIWRLRSWVFLGATIAAFVGLAVAPGFTAWVGLAATATLAFGALFGMLSATGLVLQDRPTAEVFRLLGFRRTPLVSLLVLTVLLVGAVSGRDAIHDVDRGRTNLDGTDPRLDLGQAFDSWYDQAARCEITMGTRKVRPMLLIAAEGGGIRASYWTVSGLRAIEEQTCGAYSTFLSGGASGGSVGLTVARFSGTPEEPGTERALAAVEKMAESETLSRAADGTFVRDLTYGATGVPVPRVGEVDPWRWKDRAKLIEDGWDGSGDWAQREFLAPAEGLSPSTGQLVLNSTSVQPNCRVFLSQVRLPVNPAPSDSSFDPEKNCDKNPGPATRTIDLFSAYGPYGEAQDATCLGFIRASTAALLTARFPYVTPSGTVGPCPDRRVVPGQRSEPYWPGTQLVDGGYIENSGLATLTDLSDQWLPLVRGANADALAGKVDRPALVVPLIVFLNNGDRNVTQPELGAKPTSELALPPAAYLAGGSALSNNDALLGRAQDAVELAGFCPLGGEHPAVCPALDRRFPTRVVLVDRVTQPEVGAPLGWVLSDGSITALRNAMEAQSQSTCSANAPRKGDRTPAKGDERQLSCRAGYATLGDLTRYFTFAPPR